MAATTLSAFPAAFTAGDTLLVTQTFSDYPAPDWSATLYLRQKDSARITVTASDGGSGAHLFTAAAATTEGWEPGDYYLFVTVSQTVGQTVYRYNVLKNRITIRPNLAAEDESLDPRTDNQRILDNLKTAYETLSTATAESVSVEGISYTRRTLRDLQIAIDRYQAAVDRESTADSAGADHSRRIVARFTSPT